MVSRRRILSRSRDDLSSGGGEFAPYEEEEDVWYQREKLYRDHIQEVLEKWEQIDDEIWAKVIVLERNRRVAKAYARAPVLTVNGSEEGFDGFRIGLGGFDNPWRDPKTEEIQRLIGHGVKLKMDDAGNILVKRIAKSNVYVKQTLEETAVGSEVLKLPQGCLELDKPVKLFDFKKFQQNMSRELKRAYPDRRKLEWQCLSALVFVRHEADLLDCPVWVMLINMVAMDLLKSKLPPTKRMPDQKVTRQRLPVPTGDEDPYSLASGGSGSASGSGSGGSSGGGIVIGGGGSSAAATREFKRGDKPPKLPPRDGDLAGRHHYNIPKPDYEEELEKKFAQAMSGRAADKNSKKKDPKYEDPYYCGLTARVSNFAGKGPKKDRNIGRPLPNPAAGGIPPHHLLHHPVIHHSRSYDSGMASLSGSSHYAYGHDLPLGGAVPNNNGRRGGPQYEVRYDPKYDVIRRKLIGAAGGSPAGPPPPLPPHPPQGLHPSFTAPNGINGAPGRTNREFSRGESPYEKIYGRLPLPNRAYVPAKSRTLFPSGWE